MFSDSNNNDRSAYNKLKQGVFINGGVGLFVGVLFGTAATYFSKGKTSYMSIMSKYMTSSAVSVAALLSIRGLLMSPEAMFIKQRRLVTSKTPLQQLRLLNYEPRSISSLSPTLPMYVHSRCA